MPIDERNLDPQRLLNKYVRFQISDVYVPQPADILSELHGRDLLYGRVVDLSDRGAERGAFAVVDVHGLARPIVVAVTRIVEVVE